MYTDMFFSIISGDCEIVTGGSCVVSPNYKRQHGDPAIPYPNNASCEIRMNNPTVLRAMDFETEFRYDKLYIEIPGTASSIHFSGMGINTSSHVDVDVELVNRWNSSNNDRMNVPMTFYVDKGTIMRFQSDGSIVRRGFHICTSSAGECPLCDTHCAQIGCQPTK